MKFSFFLIFILAVMLISCSSSEKNNEFSEKSLDGVKWILKSLNNKKISTPESRKEIYIEFNTSENKFSGFAGCNNIFGTYTLSNDRIKFGPVAGTEMYCESVMETENEFKKMFETADRIKLKGSELQFFSSGKITASFISFKQ